MYTTRYRTNRRRPARGPVNASRSGGIQGLVLVKDHSRAGVWLLKPTKPQAVAAVDVPDEDSSED